MEQLVTGKQKNRTAVMFSLSLCVQCTLVIAGILVTRWLIKQLFWSWVMVLYSPLSRLPTPPLNIVLANSIGDPCWGEVAYMRGLDARTVVNNLLQHANDLGPVFMLRGIMGCPVVHVLDADSLRKVLITNAGKYIKPMPMRKLLAPLIGNEGIILSEGDEHRKVRRRVAPCLHSQAINNFSQVVLLEGKKFAADLLQACQDEADRPLPLKFCAGLAACSTIFRSFFPSEQISDQKCLELQTAYGPIFDSMTSVLCEDILQSMFDILPASWLTQAVTNKRYILKEVLKLLDKAQNSLSSTSENIKDNSKTKCRTNDEESPKDGKQDNARSVISMLEIMIAPDPAAGSVPPLTERELIDNARTFLAAGQATAAMNITWAIYRLARHPKWLSKLQDELNSCEAWLNESEDPEVRMDAIENLPVLDQVIRESIRLHPPVLTTVRKLIEPDVLDGHALAEGTLIVIPIYAMHMNPIFWENPSEFDPERFLPQNDAKRDRMAWIPFLYGTRKCMAQRFVLREVKCMVASLVQVMDIETDANDPVPLMRGGLAGHPDAAVYGRPRC